MNVRVAHGAVALLAALGLAACAGRPVVHTADAAPVPPASPTGPPSATPAPSPSVVAKLAPAPSASAKPTGKPTTLKKPAPKGVDGGGGKIPPPGADGVPTHGAGTFSVAPGGTDVVGTGTTLVKYRVEVEDGITFGANPVWTPLSFAAAVDDIVAAPRGWARSAQSPVTDPAQRMANASWSFQRVSGNDFSVEIRLATPDTVDKLCGSMGMTTEGVYSCRYGHTEMINLRRWLRGAPGFAIALDGYHTMVIDHEMGHFLGFDHMKCPGAGQPAPVMQEQTIDLAGCTINPYPFGADGTFVTGPWAAS